MVSQPVAVAILLRVMQYKIEEKMDREESVQHFLDLIKNPVVASLRFISV